MLVQAKKGNIEELDLSDRAIDHVDFEWFETNRRINHKVSRSGVKLGIKFLNENPNFKEGDVLVESEDTMICVHILPCDCLVIRPRNAQEMAAACYEIGNRHVPLYLEEDELLTAFEKPLFRYFDAMNFEVAQENRQLLYPLQTTVLPHGDSKGLFTRIMKMTNQSQ